MTLQVDRAARLDVELLVKEEPGRLADLNSTRDALLFQAKPNATVQQMERAILESCTLLPDQSPLRSGHGLISPRGALEWLEKNVP